MKIAFATQDLRRIDAHFGEARHIAIYEVGATTHRFLEVVQFDGVGARIDAVAGCAMLITLAIDGAQAAQVVGKHVYPVKVTAPEAIIDVIGRVQSMLRGSPSPWLRQLMNRNDVSDQGVRDVGRR
jgi:nitrogen fixation protein NifX